MRPIGRIRGPSGGRTSAAEKQIEELLGREVVVVPVVGVVRVVRARIAASAARALVAVSRLLDRMAIFERVRPKLVVLFALLRIA